MLLYARNSRSEILLTCARELSFFSVLKAWKILGAAVFYSIPSTSNYRKTADFGIPASLMADFQISNDKIHRESDLFLF